MSVLAHSFAPRRRAHALAQLSRRRPLLLLPQGPDVKKFMGKRLVVVLQGGRRVTGRLTGYDVFFNVTLEEAVEDVSATEKHELGLMVIRGNAIVQLELLERVAAA